MSGQSKPPANIGTAIKRAILQLGSAKGSSFAEIKKYLLTKYPANGDMTDATSIKQYLKNAVEKGVLLKMDGGNFKVKETARRRRSRSRSRSKGKSKRRSRSRKRSGGRRRSRSGRRKSRRSSSRKRKSSSSGRKRRRSRRKAVEEPE